MTEPSEILPGIFVGDQYTASNSDFFRRNNILRVVNCTATLPCYFKNVEYFRIPVDDSANDVNNNLMAAYLLPAVQFVLRDRVGGNKLGKLGLAGDDGPPSGILIHCHAGVSRSCTVAVAVLRYCCVATLREAVNVLLSKRTIAFMHGRYFNFRNALLQVFHH